MMKNLRFRLFVFSLLIWFTPLTYANHIVGGELQMRPLGGAGRYEVTLIQFWDQNNLTIPRPNVSGNRDEFANLYIYQKSNKSYKATVTVDYLKTEQLTYQNRACASIRSLNTSIGYYRGSISLDPAKFNHPDGYFIVWERCCRNDDINNIEDPGDSGMVFYLEFPPVTVANSSPVFVAPNGQYICSNRSFSMNMSATDADGDELRYSIATPMRGNTDPNKSIGDSLSKSTYPFVSWSRGVSITNAIPGPGPLRVDATGKVTVTAGALGLYVFTVQCEEFRNGRRIGVVRRDFQLLVIDCNDDQPEPPVIRQNGNAVAEVTFCPEMPVELSTDDAVDWSYQWQLNGLNISGATSASIMVKDSGSYSVVKSYTKKCSRDTASSVVRATFAAPIPAVITYGKSTICAEDSTVLLANGGVIGAEQTLVWYKNDVQLEVTNPMVTVHEPGLYVVAVDDEVPGCPGRDTVEIIRDEFAVALPDRKAIQEDGRDFITPVVTPAAASYSFAWSPGDGLLSAPGEKSALVTPVREEELYHLTVTSASGCTVVDSVLVYMMKRMYIPSSFTPNGDGRNDTFEIFNAREQIVQMRIYNRWGELIYKTEGYEHPWDGTYRNVPVPAGSYPYIISTETQEIQGTVLLLK
ncbi:MAG: gliding motility-associated C-terminal domain-containing protein [Dyadobacter fermentans]